MADGVDPQILALFNANKSSQSGVKSSQSGAKSADPNEFSRVLDRQRAQPADSTGSSRRPRTADSGNDLPSERRDVSASSRASDSSGPADSESSSDSATVAGSTGPRETATSEQGTSAQSSSAATGAPTGETDSSVVRDAKALAASAGVLGTLPTGDDAAEASITPLRQLAGVDSSTANPGNRALTAAGVPGQAPATTDGPDLAATNTATAPLDSAEDTLAQSTRAAPDPAAATTTGSDNARQARSAEAAEARVRAERSALTTNTEDPAQRTAATRESIASAVDAATAKQRVLADPASTNAANTRPEASGAGLTTTADEDPAGLLARAARGDANQGLGQGRGPGPSDTGLNTRPEVASRATANDMQPVNARAGDKLEAGVRGETRGLDSLELSSLGTRGADSSGPAQVSASSSAAATVAAAPLATGGAGSTSAAATLTGATAELAMDRGPEDPEFANEFTARMKVLVRDGVREARLQLNPAELGRLQVTVSTEGDQARISFVAETSAAREAIEQSLPRLRDMLEQNGLQLAQSDVDQRGPMGEGRGESESSRVAHGEQSSDTETGDERVARAGIVDGSRIDTYI